MNLLLFIFNNYYNKYTCLRLLCPFENVRTFYNHFESSLF